MDTGGLLAISDAITKAYEVLEVDRPERLGPSRSVGQNQRLTDGNAA